MNGLERELKLTPLDAAVLDRLAATDHFGEFTVQRRRRELQRNAFFDTSARALSAARLGFRRRVTNPHALATWTLKADGQLVRGVAARPEVELQLSADTPPALAVAALRQAAQQRGAAVLAEQLSDALAVGGLPLAQPFLETHTERTILDLEASSSGSRIELALDRVVLVGHAFSELEIEAELKRGEIESLEMVRQAIAALGAVRESEGSKLSRAVAHLDVCQCR